MPRGAGPDVVLDAEGTLGRRVSLGDVPAAVVVPVEVQDHVEVVAAHVGAVGVDVRVPVAANVARPPLARPVPGVVDVRVADTTPAAPQAGAPPPLRVFRPEHPVTS